MVKIFIVDDEILVRMGIKMMIDWGKNGFEIVGEAANGYEAIEKIKQTTPDLIITDLKMPEMDGIGLIKKLKSAQFRGKIIVLSNYDEFDLVKEAMKFGAAEYLLKVTLEGDDLIKAINSLSIDLVLQDENERANSKKVVELFENKSVIKEKYICDLVDGTISLDGFITKTEILGLSVGRKSWVINVIVDDFNQVYNKEKADRGSIDYTIENIIEGIIDRKYEGEVFIFKKGIFIILLNAIPTSKISIDENAIRDLCQEIKVLIKRYVDFDASFIFSSKVIEIGQMAYITNQLLTEVEARFYMGHCSILKLGENLTLSNEIDDKYWQIKSDIKETLGFCDSKIFTLLDELVKHIEEKKYNYMVRERICSNLFTIIEDVVRKEGGDLYKIVDRNEFIFLKSASTIMRFKDILYSVFSKLLEYIKDLNSNYIREDIAKAIEYIKRKYREKISLEDVAGYVNMNKNYFCKLFKSESGLSPVEYIIKVKVDKAKELLKDSGMNVSEVARYLGYDDISYFNRLFKKSTGINPGVLLNK